MSNVVVVVVDDVYYRKLTYTQILDFTLRKMRSTTTISGNITRRKSVTYYMSHPSSYLLSSLIFGSSRFVGLAPSSHASYFIPQGHRNEMRLVEHAQGGGCIEWCRDLELMRGAWMGIGSGFAIHRSGSGGAAQFLLLSWSCC